MAENSFKRLDEEQDIPEFQLNGIEHKVFQEVEGIRSIGVFVGLYFSKIAHFFVVIFGGDAYDSEEEDQ